MISALAGLADQRAARVVLRQGAPVVQGGQAGGIDGVDAGVERGTVASGWHGI
jgi:hypothetical protein